MKTDRLHDPRIAVIGGGTGLSTMLRGLKKLSRSITAIVTVADDGGGSGMLRQDLGMPPPGDVRNCIQALANTEPIMEKLLAYRFTEGSLKGQSFGNLFLAALNGMSDTFDEAVRRMSDVLAITGRVLPVTNENVYLAAEFDDGTEAVGESHIAEFKKGTDKRIRRVRLIPERPRALPQAIEAIEEADMIVLGPGSLYTSIMPNLVTEGVAEAIARSDAFRIYVLNVMTQDGETEGYSASDHLKALMSHGGKADVCLYNTDRVARRLLEKYAGESARQLWPDPREFRQMGVELTGESILSRDAHFVRHDPLRLAYAVMKTAARLAPRQQVLRYYDELMLRQEE